MKIYFSSLLIKSFSVLMTLLLNVYLTNNLTLEQFGIYTLTISALIITLPILTFSSNTSAIPIITKFINLRKPSLTNGYFFGILNLTGIISIIVFIIFLILSHTIFENSLLIESYKILILFLFVIGGVEILGSIIRVYGKFLQVEFANGIARPLLISILLMIFGFFGVYINPVLAYGVSSFLIGIYLFFHLSRSYEVKYTVNKNYKWVKKSIPFILISFSFLFNSQIEIIMIGLLMDAKSVALFTVPYKLATLVSLSLVAYGVYLGPVIAKKFASKKILELKKGIFKISIVISSIALSSSLFLYIFNDQILNYFGSEYVKSKNILFYLVIGQLFNVIAGPAGLFLTMTNNEKLVIKVLIIVNLISIVINLILIQNFDLVGAAIANLLSIVFLNIILLHYVKKKLKISTSFILGKS
jgi:O-antigen/teichoic acid export membrane protein